MKIELSDMYAKRVVQLVANLKRNFNSDPIQENAASENIAELDDIIENHTIE